MANAKAEAFKKFIESKDSGAFGVEEIPKDELHTVLFHSRLKAGNVEYPFIVTVDDSVFVTLRVLLDQAVVKGEKRAAVLEEMNRLNHTYKSFKHYVDQGGSMVLDACLIMPEKNGGIPDLQHADYDDGAFGTCWGRHPESSRYQNA